MGFSVIGLVGVFDDEAGFEAGDFFGEVGGFYGLQDFVEILICCGSFVLWVLAAVGEDVGVVEGLVDFLLVEFADGGFAAFDSAGAVVDGVGGFGGAFGGDHYAAAGLRVARQQNRMAGGGERRVLELRVACRKSAGGAFAVDPGEAFVAEGFLTGDVVRDEVDEVTFGAGEDFLEGFEDEGVDEEVIEGGEVGAEGHVVDVAVGLPGAEGGVDELFVARGEGGGPFFELGLKGFELVVGELVAEAAGAAVGEEGDVAVLEAEGVGDFFHAGLDGDDFGFAEVVAAAVGAELCDFFGEVRQPPPDVVVEEGVEAAGEGVGVVFGAEVEGVFAAGGPFVGDAEGFAVFLGGAVDGDLFALFGGDAAGFFDGALAAAGAGGDAFEDGVDDVAADFGVVDFARGDVELEEGHGAFDVDADGAGVDVGGGDEDAADGRAVAAVGIGVEDEVGDAGGAAGVEGLGDAEVVEGVAEFFGGDDGDGGEGFFARGEDGGGGAGFDEGGGWGGFGGHGCSVRC